MALTTKPNTFSTGATIVASEHNDNFDTLYNDYNGNITNVNLSASAAIVDTKFAQIITAGKVSGTALTGLANIPAVAGLLPGANGGLPSGAIILWSGAISAIPTGFVICDGTNSTPNLTDRFVIHASADAGATYDVGDTGGSATHTHAVPRDGWGVSGDQSAGRLLTTSGATAVNIAGNDLAATAAGSTIPPYYALAYIMKT